MIIIYLYPVAEPCTSLILSDPTQPRVQPVPATVSQPSQGGGYAGRGSSHGRSVFYGKLRRVWEKLHLVPETAVPPVVEIAKPALKHYRLTCEGGTFAVTGTDAALVRSYRLQAESASVTLTGADAALLAHRVLVARVGRVRLTGGEAYPYEGLTLDEQLAREDDEWLLMSEAA